MLRKVVLFACVSAFCVYAQDFSFLPGPTLVDSNAGTADIPPQCLGEMKTTISASLQQSLSSRLFQLSPGHLLNEDDRVLIVLPSVSMIRDFKEVIAGDIARHSIVISGQLQVVDPQTNFTIGSIPQLIEANQNVGASRIAESDRLVTDACQQVARIWAQKVSTRALQMKVARLGPIDVVPLPKSFIRSSGGLLLAGRNLQIKTRTSFKGRSGKIYNVVDVQDTFSVVEENEAPTRKIQQADSAIITANVGLESDRDRGTTSLQLGAAIPRSKPLIAVEANDFARLYNALAPEASFQDSQLASMFASYLSRPETVDVLLKSAIDTKDSSFAAFDEDLSRKTADGTSGGHLSASRAAMVSLYAEQPSLTARLRLSEYRHTTKQQPDGSALHTFELAISCELVDTDPVQGERQLTTVFQGEIRQRVEKQGVREIDNRMTLAYLTRSVLAKVAAKTEEYIAREYIPTELRARQSITVTVSNPHDVQWASSKPSSLQPVSIYRSHRLTGQERPQIASASATVLEFLGTTNAYELASGGSQAQPGDLLVYTADVMAKVPIAVKFEFPKQMAYGTIARAGFGAVVQNLLEEYSRSNQQLRFPSAPAWDISDSGGIEIAFTLLGVNMMPSGCTATFQVRTWAGHASAIALHDKEKAFYKGTQYVSDPVDVNDQDICLASAIMTFLPTYRKSLDITALSNQVRGITGATNSR